MFVNQLALVSKSRSVPMADVSRIAAALQKQITRDFSPIWQVPATISAFPNLRSVPAGYWPIVIMDDIGMSGAAGIHLDRNGQPYALVQVGGNTPLVCSHECLEMLADPYGNHFIASNSIKPGQGRVNYLVEVCDPSEAEGFSYRVNGIQVSDFYTPHFFDPVNSSNIAYSFTGAIKKPRQILKGGYLSWQIPETREWWQGTFFGDALSFRNLGILQREGGKSWREIIDAKTSEPLKEIMAQKIHVTVDENDGLQSLFAVPTTVSASEFWAKTLEEDIDKVIADAN